LTTKGFRAKISQLDCFYINANEKDIRSFMIFQLWIRKAVSACVLLAVFTTTSMVALAGSGRVAAELTVSGKALNGEAPVVLVNGEPSKNGRSIFSSSTIETPEETTAVVSIGRTGRLELDPKTTVNVIFDDQSISAELTAGKLTVVGSLDAVKVRTNDGKVTTLQAGDSITASGEPAAKRQGGGSDKWWIWVVVAAGAAAAVIIAVAASNDDDDVVSPNR